MTSHPCGHCQHNAPLERGLCETCRADKNLVRLYAELGRLTKRSDEYRQQLALMGRQYRETKKELEAVCAERQRLRTRRTKTEQTQEQQLRAHRSTPLPRPLQDLLVAILIDAVDDDPTPDAKRLLALARHHEFRYR
jgi:hypothetical protein